MILDICQCRIVTQLLSKWAGQNCKIWNLCLNIVKSIMDPDIQGSNSQSTTKIAPQPQPQHQHLYHNHIQHQHKHLELTSDLTSEFKVQLFPKIVWMLVDNGVQPWLGRLFANDLRLPVAGSQQRFIFNYVSINLCIAINGTLRLSRRKNQLWCESFRSWERNCFSFFSAKSSDEILTLITGYWADKSP